MLWRKFVLTPWTFVVAYRYSWIRFMWTFKTYGINFILFLGSCCFSGKTLVTIIYRDRLHFCAYIPKIPKFLKRPLHLVFNKAATIVLHRISSLHIIWFSHINICVVTKQMRDKTTRKVNKWPTTKAMLRFFLEKFAGSSWKPITM